jgi:hypothetical protein
LQRLLAGVHTNEIPSGVAGKDATVGQHGHGPAFAV